MLLRPASTAIVTIIRAESALASYTIIAGEAIACAGGAVACTFVRALYPWVKVISIDNITNPRVIFRASAKRAIRPSPFRFAIQTSKTFAIVVRLASSVTRTVILAHTTLTMSSFIPSDLSP